MNSIRHNPIRTLLTVLLAALITACERRDLWVYGDDLSLLTLVTDWSRCNETPGGMTYIFFPKNGYGTRLQRTTAEVHSTRVALDEGSYQLLLFNYSPAEFSNQDILGLENISTARVTSRTELDQHASLEPLFGYYSWKTPLFTDNYGSYADSLDSYQVTGTIPDQGYVHDNQSASRIWPSYEQPEQIDAYTEDNIEITREMSVAPWQLIHYEDRDDFTSTLREYEIDATPDPFVWDIEVIVYIRNPQYYRAMQASIAGLSITKMLATAKTTQEAGHIYIPAFTRGRYSDPLIADDSVAIFSARATTFGLQPLDEGMERQPDQVRLNLLITQRDNRTLREYHYDVGQEILVYPEQRLLRIIIRSYGDRLRNYPIMPYVLDEGQAGFDAVVDPWDQEEDLELNM